MKLFEGKKIGISFSDKEIRFLELYHSRETEKTDAKFKKNIDEGIIKKGYVADTGRLKKIFKEALEKFGGKKSEIILGVPEENVYSFLLSAEEGLGEDGLDKKISSKLPGGLEGYIAKKNIIEDLNYKQENDNSSKLYFVSAVEKKFIESWQSFFKKTPHSISSFAPKLSSLGSFVSGYADNFVVLNIGAKNFSLSVFVQKQELYSYKTELDAVTVEGMTEEGLKNFDALKLGPESFYKHLFENIFSELEEALAFINDRFDIEVKKIFLCGEAYRMKNIDKYFNKEFKDLSLQAKLCSDISADIKIDPEFILPLSLGKRESKKYYFSTDRKKLSLNFLSKKYSKAVLIFLFISTFLFFIAFIFWGEKNTPPNPLPEEKEIFSKQHEYKYPVYLAADNISRPGELSGRIVNIDVEEPMSYQSVLDFGREKVLKKINQDKEFLWDRPINEIKKDSIIFPLELSWYVGEKKSLEIFLERFSSDLPDNLQYKIETQKDGRVEKTSFPDLYKSEIKLVLKHNGEIDELAEVFYKKVAIINTAGYLINIRRGPGTDFEVVAKAQEGERYDLVEQKDAWSKIILANGREAWIASRFLEEIKY